MTRSGSAAQDADTPERSTIVECSLDELAGPAVIVDSGERLRSEETGSL